MAKRKKRKSQSRVNTPQVRDSQRGAEVIGQDNHINKKRGANQTSDAVAAQLPTPVPPWLFWLTVFLIVSPAIVGPYGQRGGYTPDLHMAAYIQVLSVLVFVLYIFSRTMKRPIELPNAPLLIPVLLFYLWAMLSLFWALNHYEAMRTALNYTGALVGGLLVVLLVKDMQAVHKLLFVMVLSGLLIALLGIGQILFGIDWVQQHIVPAATFSNKNMAGHYGLLTFPLAIIYFFNSKTTRGTWFFALASALILVFMYYTRSRGIWVSALVEIIVLMIFLAYWRFVHKHILLDTRDKKLGLIVGILLVVSMSYVTPSMLGNTKAVVAASIGVKEAPAYYAENGWSLAKSVVAGIRGTGHIRLRIWTNSIPMLIDHFFIGTGLGNWTVHYPQYQSWVEQDAQLVNNQFHANAHNDYVEFICELGIIGFILVLLILAALVKTVTALLSVKHESKDGFLMFAPMLALIGIGVDAVFSFPFKQPVPLLFVLVYLAILSCVYASHISKKQHTIATPSATYCWSIGAIPLIAGVMLFVVHYNLFQSEIYYRKAAVLSQQSGKETGMLRAARQAYEYNPLRTKLLWFEATALLKLGQVKKSIPLLMEVLANYPYSRNTLYNLASAHVGLNQYAEATHYLEELMSVQEVELATVQNYLNILLQSKQYKKILAEVEVPLARFGAKLKELEQQKHVHKGKVLQARQGVKALERIKKQAQKQIKKSSNT